MLWLIYTLNVSQPFHSQCAILNAASALFVVVKFLILTVVNFCCRYHSRIAVSVILVDLFELRCCFIHPSSCYNALDVAVLLYSPDNTWNRVS